MDERVPYPSEEMKAADSSRSHSRLMPVLGSRWSAGWLRSESEVKRSLTNPGPPRCTNARSAVLPDVTLGQGESSRWLLSPVLPGIQRSRYAFAVGEVVQLPTVADDQVEAVVPVGRLLDLLDVCPGLKLHREEIADQAAPGMLRSRLALALP